MKLVFKLFVLFYFIGIQASLGQSNTYPYPSSGNIGIGTNSPSSTLHIVGETRVQGTLRLHSLDGNYAGILETTNESGAANGLKIISSRGAGYISFLTNNTNGATEKLRISNSGNVGIGTTSPSHKLEVNGSIKTKEVNVTATGWPDYVFSDEYELLPLSEVKDFYTQNSHLPNIPSEKEIIEKGVNVSEMTIKLLEKIEELTIYLVSQNERIDQLEKQLKNYEKY